jgi:hypothetical protein
VATCLNREVRQKRAKIDALRIGVLDLTA